MNCTSILLCRSVAENKPLGIFAAVTAVVLPVLQVMLDVYRLPRDFARFESYLKALQGDAKDGLALPIGGFNPMAKPHVLQRMEQLESLRIEEIMADALGELTSYPVSGKMPCPPMRVAFNLADDVGGGWTNRYTTDYDARFKLSALVKRGFITPMFWVSEDITVAGIRLRTLQACFRTVHWLQHGAPQTLDEHLAQERYAASRTGDDQWVSGIDRAVKGVHGASTHPAVIFSALYGDDACRALGYAALGFEGGTLLPDAR